jgi:DNA-binding PadR family transcriptional regulator
MSSSSIPPTPLTLHILLALAAGEMTASEISAQITQDSNGAMILRVSSYYKALRRLLAEEMIETGSGDRYRLTGKARRILGWERARLLPVASLLRMRID